MPLRPRAALVARGGPPAPRFAGSPRRPSAALQRLSQRARRRLRRTTQRVGDVKPLTPRSTSAQKTGTHHDRPTGIIKSAARAVRILRGILRAREARSLTEISTQHRLPKATVLRLLRTLVAEGIVARDRAGRYSPSPRSLIALNSVVGPGRSLIADVQDMLDRLARQTGGTTLLALPDETDRRVYAPVYGLPPTSVVLDPTESDPVPLHTTASGRCYLAALTPRRLAGYIDQALAPPPSGRTVSPSKLRKELRLVRKQGFALNRGEAIRAFPGAAAPLRGPDGAVVGGLGLALFAQAGGLDRAAESIPLLQTTAEAISQLLSDESWGARVAALDLEHHDWPPIWDGPELTALDGPGVPVRSVSRVVRVMATMMRFPAGVSVSELMQRRGLDRSTLRRLLWTLESGGLARRDAITGLHRAHPLVWLRLAPALRTAMPLLDASLRILQRLSESLGATVCLAVIDSDARHTVALQYALPPRPVAFHPGRASPPLLHATASGKCLLAHRSGLGIERYLSAGLEACTPHTITSPDRLMEELAATRKAGFALSSEEFALGLGGVAVPVATPGAEVSAALAAVPLIAELTKANLRDWLPRLWAAASALSVMLGPDWRERLTVDQP